MNLWKLLAMYMGGSLGRNFFGKEGKMMVAWLGQFCSVDDGSMGIVTEGMISHVRAGLIFCCR